MKKYPQDDNFELPPLEQCNLTAIRLGSHLLAKVYDAALAPAGIKNIELSMIALLGRRADTPPSVTELATTLAMSRSAARQHLLQLEQGGLVCAAQPGAASRGQRYALTDAGQLKLREALPRWRAAQSYFEKIYGAQPAQELRETLRHIAQDQQLHGPGIDHHAEPGGPA